jgi:hypothetical protein
MRKCIKEMLIVIVYLVALASECGLAVNIRNHEDIAEIEEFTE